MVCRPPQDLPITWHLVDGIPVENVCLTWKLAQFFLALERSDLRLPRTFSHNARPFCVRLGALVTGNNEELSSAFRWEQNVS